MSKFKHTPGPWKVDPNYPHDIQTESGVIEIATTSIALSGGLPAKYEDRKANARLIAAAPELLEALQDAVEYLKNYLPDEMIAPHLAAITKATGKQKHD